MIQVRTLTVSHHYTYNPRLRSSPSWAFLMVLPWSRSSSVFAFRDRDSWRLQACCFVAWPSIRVVERLLVIRFTFCVFGRNIAVFPLHPLEWYTVSGSPFIDGVDGGPLMKVDLSGFSHCGVFFFSLCNLLSVRWDVLWNSIFHLSSNTIRFLKICIGSFLISFNGS